MTMDQIMSYKPTATNGKILVDKKIFEEMKALCVQAQVCNAIKTAEENYARTGIKHDADEVLAKLRAKYVR